MSTSMTEHVSPRRLWVGILASPIAWVVHFGVAWLSTELGCAFNWNTISIFFTNAIVAMTLLATLLLLPITSYAGITAYRQWQRHASTDNSHDNESGQWWRFMARLGMMNSAVFSFAILLETIPLFVIPICN